MQMAQLDELRTVEVKALDMEPAARGEPSQTPVDCLLDMCGEIVPMGTQEAQALRRILRGGIVAIETVAGGASVDEVLDVVGATCRLRVEVIHLQLTPTDVSETPQ